jgi:hypothetical protein
MQRNGAAPVFSFLLCVWGRACGLTELIHNPGSASTRGPVDLVRRHVIQRLVSSLRVVKDKVGKTKRGRESLWESHVRAQRLPLNIGVFLP